MLQEVLSNSRGEYEFNDLREDEYYIIAEFNKEKYYVTTTGASNDISTSSRFEMVATTEDEPYGKAIASNLEISTGVKTISNCNLGLSVKKDFRINVKKYISKIELTNNFGITQTKEYNRENLVKLDVKDINNLKIKVVYLVEVENIGYYPGYVYNIRDYIPTGMTFNENYKENANWYKEPGDVNNVLNNSLSNKLIYAGQKEVLTVAFDITRKEAGSFKNIVEITEDNLEIFRKNEISKGGN